MTVTIRNSNQYGSLDVAELLSFEKQLNMPLPPDYRAFLLLHNGGIPEPGDFVISFELGHGNLAEFYGLHSGPQYKNLSCAWAISEDSLPIGLLPIGGDPGGKPICIWLTGENIGKIYFWDHELDDYAATFGYHNPFPLADSLASFLANLLDASVLP